MRRAAAAAAAAAAAECMQECGEVDVDATAGCEAAVWLGRVCACVCVRACVCARVRACVCVWAKFGVGMCGMRFEFLTGVGGRGGGSITPWA